MPHCRQDAKLPDLNVAFPDQPGNVLGMVAAYFRSFAGGNPFLHHDLRLSSVTHRLLAL